MIINVISYKKQAVAIFALVCSASFASSFGMQTIFQIDITALSQYLTNKNAAKLDINDEQKNISFESLLKQITQRIETNLPTEWNQLKNIINDATYYIPQLYYASYLNLQKSNPNNIETLQKEYQKNITAFFKNLENYLIEKYKNVRMLYDFIGSKQSLINNVKNEITKINKRIYNDTPIIMIKDKEEQKLDTEKLDVDKTELETPGTDLAASSKNLV